LSSIGADDVSPGEANFIPRDSIPWSGARRMRVELDKKSLFALASDTRLEMLKSLQPMRRTVSQLSEELGIDKSAIHRHLKKMEEGGLVKRFEEHGFVYYGLTWKARDLISPNESTRVVIILSATWIILLAVVILLAAIGLVYSNSDSPQTLVPRSGDQYDELQTDEYALSHDSFMYFTIAAILASAALILLFIAYRIIRKPLQGSPEKSTGLDLPDQVVADD
jgi:DNA-binding transcriptional ArsR family regulator